MCRSHRISKLLKGDFVKYRSKIYAVGSDMTVYVIYSLLHLRTRSKLQQLILLLDKSRDARVTPCISNINVMILSNLQML